MKVERRVLVALSAILGAVVVLFGAGLVGWYWFGWDRVGPNGRTVDQVFEQLNGAATLVVSAILALISWMLYLVTVQLNKSSDQLADVARRQFDENGPVPRVTDSSFVPSFDREIMNVPVGETLPDPLLEVEVRNIGGRPMTITKILVEENQPEPEHDDEGNIIGADVVTFVHAYDIIRASHVAGVDNPIPVGGTAKWTLNQHGIDYEGGGQFRVGVEDANGRQAWGDRFD